MALAIRFHCPSCSATFTVAPELAGRKGLCPRCQTAFRVPQPASEPPAPLAPAPDAIELEASQEGVLRPSGPVELPADYPERAAALARSQALPAEGRLDASYGAHEARAPRPREGPGDPGAPQARRGAGNLVLGGLIAALVIGGLALGLALRSPLAARPDERRAPLAQVSRAPQPGPAGPAEQEAPARAEPRGKGGARVLEAIVARLEEDARYLAQDPPLARRGERSRLHLLLLRLRESPGAGPFAERLAALERALERAAAAEGEARLALAQRERAERALAQLGARFALELEQRLAEPAQGFSVHLERRLAGEEGELRPQLRRALSALRQDPQRALRAPCDPRWLGLLGSQGYARLIALGEGLTRRLELATWPALRRELSARQAAARAFEEAHLAAYRAFLERDHPAALAAARRSPDAWSRALLAQLESPEGRSWFRGTRAVESRPPGESAPEPEAHPPEVSVDLLREDWRLLLARLAKRYRKERSQREAILREWSALLTRLVEVARARHALCAEVVERLDEHERVLTGEAALRPGRLELHRLYFDEELRLAAGPADFYRLDAWCKERDHEVWRTQLRPWLERLRPSGPSLAQQEAERERRFEARRAVARYQRERIGFVVAGLSELIGWLAAEGYRPRAVDEELRGLIGRAVVRAGAPLDGRRLLARLAEVEDRGPRETRQTERGYRSRLDELTDHVVKRSLRATRQAIGADEPGLAFDLFEYALLLDPDNERAHKGLGHVRVKGQWLRRFAAARLEQGWRWDARLAWVRLGEEERYARGEVYDLTQGKWLPLEQADRFHGEAAHPWVIRSEHFELRSTAPLARSAWLAERLEAFYLAMFRQYDLFFASKGGVKWIFGQVKQPKPLVVHVYRDRAQYLAEADPVPGSAGFYSPSEHASYFYDQGPEVSTLQHEVTHQILGEISGGSAAAWVGEGAAVYLEDTAFVDGAPRVGGPADNRDLVGYMAELSAGRALRLSEVIALTQQSEWNANLSGKNYRGAGAVVHFLMHVDGGRYRADFVRLLRDSYWGKPIDVARATNLSVELLEALMERYYAARARR